MLDSCVASTESSPVSDGVNRSSVNTIAPTKIYSPYELMLPVSADERRELAPYSDSDSPNGPSSSITPRSRIFDVYSPNASAGSMIYRL